MFELEKDARPYGKVIFAGTFDHLHEGHKHLLRTAYHLGAKVAIGLTSDSMLEGKSNRSVLQSYEERYKKLEHFLRSEGVFDRCTIFSIETVDGGADKMEDLEALIVSDELKVVRNALDINEKRVKNGLRRFHIIVVPMVRTPDNRPISSSRIRDGEEFDPNTLLY